MMGKNYHTKIKSSYINIRYSRLQKKVNYQGQRETLYNDKRVNPPKRHSNPKCVCTKNQSCKISETRNGRTTRRNKPIHRLLLTTDRATKQTIDKDIELSTINYQVLIDIYKTLHMPRAEYIFFQRNKNINMHWNICCMHYTLFVWHFLNRRYNQYLVIITG